MPITLVGFYEDSIRDGLKAITALADEHITVSGDDITVPILNKIIGAAIFSSSIEAAQLNSPSLRRLFQPDFFPLDNSPYPSGDGHEFHDYTQNPIELEMSEKINALIDSGSSTEKGFCFLWLGDGTPVPARGDIRTIKATITGGDTSRAWANQALTLSQTLPVGRYAVVGMHTFPANPYVMVASRLVFVGGTWRPGILGGMRVYQVQPKVFRRGEWGIWGEFEYDQPPTIDYISAGATGAIQVFLDLLQLRAGR